MFLLNSPCEFFIKYLLVTYFILKRDAPDENEARFTVEEAVEKAGFGRFQWRLSILTGMAWMADAMELMILSIIAPALRCEWKLDSWKEALVSTVVFVGMMCSSAFWGKICDRHG